MFPSSSNRLLAAKAASVVALSCLSIAPVASALGSSPSGVVTGASTTETFNYTGSVQTWTVPTGVTSVDVVVRGAQGGAVKYDTGSATGISAPGGGGGATTATLEVTPGGTLNIFVGQMGESATDSAAGAGGYNGGGASGVVSVGSYIRFYAGGGGGASDIRIGGTSLSDRVVVAGGGGGTGLSGNGGGGGQAGNAGGGNPPAGQGGTGGTASSGGTGGGGAGTGGVSCPVAGQTGANGSLGTGGAGGDGGGGGGNTATGGGGGGGGYYGGGGGGGACDQNLASGGGGGGSSYADPALTSGVSYSDNDRSGDGVVTITWSAPVPAIDATGSGRTISGSGSLFPASSTVTFTIDGVTVGTASTDADGDFTFELTGLDCSIVTGTLTATSGAVSATDSFTLDACPEPAIDATGSGRTISGSGSLFPASSTVTFTIDGVTVGTASTDADGDFTFELTGLDCSIVSGTLTATSGEVTATDTFSVSPCPGVEVLGSGRPATGSGEGFPASSTVTLTIDGVTVGTVSTDADGEFTFELTDLDCNVMGGTLTATSGEVTATDAFTLSPCPGLEISGWGRRITGSGEGFPASSTVTFTIDGVTVGTATTDADGEFTFRLGKIKCSITSGDLTATSGEVAVTVEFSIPICFRPPTDYWFGGPQVTQPTEPTGKLPNTGTNINLIVGAGILLLVVGFDLRMYSIVRRRYDD